MRRRVAWFLALAVVFGSVGVGAVGEYEIAIEGSYETPAETVTVDGEEFTVRAVSAAKPGETLTVHVTAPADEDYQINLYTVDQQIQDFRLGTGNETVVFETAGLDPGSYVVAAVDNDEFYTVHPVVVSEYELDVSVPDRVSNDTAFDVTVTLDPLSGATTPGDVELVFWNEEARERHSLTHVDDRTYETTVPGLANGTYAVYAGVLARETVDGEDNVVGLSEPQTIAVDHAEDGSQNSTGNSTTSDGTGDSNESQSNSTSPTSPTDDPNDDVIQPNNTSTPNGSDDDGAGFGLGVAVVAILGSVLVARWRDRGRCETGETGPVRAKNGR